jgi:CheY-like chemotaxis protein
MVLSDIKMPEMDGFGLMREIRALGPDAGGRVPVIAMTTCLIQGERASGLDAGFQACLPKPCTPDKLSETILAVLNDQGDSISLDYRSLHPTAYGRRSVGCFSRRTRRPYPTN